MKYTRRFEFYPSWESRGFHWESQDDLFPVNFNACCKLLNDRGWEVISFEWIEDNGSVYHKKDSMRSLIIVASKETEHFEEEEYYFVSLDKKGETYA